MLSIRKEFHFSSAHMIVGHPKCGRMHGHNYKLEVVVMHPKHKTLEDSELDEMGFIIDFGVLKKIVKEIVDEVDHRYMVSNANRQDNCPYYLAGIKYRPDDIAGLPIPQTSAEYLAGWFKEKIQLNLAEHGYGSTAVAEVTLWETPTSYARK